MKTLIAIVGLLVAPVAAKACDPIGVASVAVQSHCAPVAVQSFGIAVPQAVQIQTVQPLFVQPFAVVQQHAAVVQQAHVQRVRVQNIRQPRVRQRSVTIQRFSSR